jgi:hypothetical protein
MPSSSLPPAARIALSDGNCLSLLPRGTMPAPAHVFDANSIDAVNAALAARRPLLVRGEPGTGKSQLARAVAEYLGRPLITHVVDSRTEARDLLWEFDAVARLAEAQLQGALGRPGPVDEKALRAELAPERFVRPGALWWALNWESGTSRCSRCRAKRPPPHRSGSPELARCS